MKPKSLTLIAATAFFAGVATVPLVRAQTETSVAAQELEIKKKELELEKAKLDAAKSEELAVEKAKLDVAEQKLELEKARRELAVKETEAQLQIELSGEVLFDTNEAVIKPAAREKLRQVGVVLAAYPQGAVVVTGHTDSRGSEALNLALAEKRAEAVKVWLMNQSGVAADRIASKAMGEDAPAASNATSEGRQLNRRVEITVAKN